MYIVITPVLVLSLPIFVGQSKHIPVMFFNTSIKLIFTYTKSELRCFISPLNALFSDALDNLDERVKTFFKKCTQPNMKQEWKDEQFKGIKQVRYTVNGLIFMGYQFFRGFHGGSTTSNTHENSDFLYEV